MIQPTAETLIAQIDWQKMDGLIPAIVQHHISGQVLMLGYMNADAVAQTLNTGHVTFFARTKKRLWVKGETSGNFLTLKSVALDCDNDALLVQASPAGATCHKGTTTCWGDNVDMPQMAWLAHLNEFVADRKNADAGSSYTADLYKQGTKRIAQKVGEEGVETALSATAGDWEELKNESADLLYHLLVLLNQTNVPLTEVIKTLKSRHKP